MEPPFIKHGGRALRYQEHRGAKLGFHDPVTNSPVANSTEILVENWLLHRFDPRVAALRIPYRYLLGAPDQNARKTKVHLDIDWKDGSRELQVVADAASETMPRGLQRVAKALGATATLRLRPQIRKNMTLITNLRHVRRQMVQHAYYPTHVRDALDALILRHLGEGAQSVGELWRACLPAMNAFVDARLGSLHGQGVVVLDLEGGLYGDRTTARKA